jgi:tetratricopeptide (TPR) repeat protein
MFERAAAWHQQRMAAGDSSTDRLDGLALALLYAGRYNEARRAAAALAALGPSDTLPDRPAVWQRWALWYDGMSAAGLGDRDGALAVIGRLDSVPRLPPHLEYQQSIRYLKATIYAALGEVAQAMPLLLDAFAEGELLSPRGRHLSPELAPVRDLPAFRRMVDKVR